MPTPSPEFAAGLLSASSRPCPVESCQAEPEQPCVSSITSVRPKDKSQPPIPFALAGPHFERVLPEHPTNRKFD